MRGFLRIFPILLTSNNHNITLVCLLLFLFGMSSAGQALSFTMIDDCNSKNVLGTAASFLNTVIMVGAMIIDPIVGWLLKFNWDGVTRDGVPFYSINDYKFAFLIIPILFFAAFVLSLHYKEKIVRDDEKVFA